MCGRPTKGHIGKPGENCTLEPLRLPAGRGRPGHGPPVTPDPNIGDGQGGGNGDGLIPPAQPNEPQDGPIQPELPIDPVQPPVGEPPLPDGDPAPDAGAAGGAQPAPDGYGMPDGVVPVVPVVPGAGGAGGGIVPNVPGVPVVPDAGGAGGGIVPGGGVVPRPVRPVAPGGGGQMPVYPIGVPPGQPGDPAAGGVGQMPAYPAGIPPGQPGDPTAGGGGQIPPYPTGVPTGQPGDPWRYPAFPAYPQAPGPVPGQYPRFPGLPGQYPSQPIVYGRQPGSDGPRLPVGPDGFLGGAGSVPGVGVSAAINNDILSMVNDCMARLSCALQGTGQPRGSGPGVWPTPNPANPGASGMDIYGNPYYNVHVGGAGGSGQRQTARDPYQPGSMMHKMRALGVPTKTIDLALEGDYVDLADFLPPIGASSYVSNPELEAVVDNSTNSVTYRPKKYTRKILNYDTWCSGWNNYEKLMVAYFGSAVHEFMSDYRTFIQESSRKYVWQAVSIYDFRHRTRLATMISLSDRLNFSSTFNDTNNTVLDTTAIRQNAPRCLRCKAYDHMIQDCPFPETKSENQKKNQTQTQEVCLNFNREKCVTANCRRKHVCQKCRGVLPYAKCQISGACANQRGIPTSA